MRRAEGKPSFDAVSVGTQLTPESLKLGGLFRVVPSPVVTRESGLYFPMSINHWMLASPGKGMALLRAVCHWHASSQDYILLLCEGLPEEGLEEKGTYLLSRERWDLPLAPFGECASAR